MIYKNPYYINKDPLKNILILGYDGSKPIFVRNPLTLPHPEHGLILMKDGSKVGLFSRR